MEQADFNPITLLITHYNRSNSLARLLNTFNSQQIEFGNIVVSDDGSKPEHMERLKELQQRFNFKLVTAAKNMGLGNNINKGQDAVETPYTLYVQEDFDPFPGFAVHLGNAFEIMEQRADIDIVRFYAYFKYPYLKPYKNGFSEMIFKIWYPGYRKFHCYSDSVHLRRSNFFQKFGRYPEGLKGDRAEFRMALAFLKNKGKGMFYEEFNEVFDHINSTDEPSMMNRNNLRQSTNPFIAFPRMIYRNVSHTIELLSMPV